MNIINLLQDKKKFVLLFLIASFIVSGITEPIIKSSLIKNWDRVLVEKTSNNENKINTFFSDQIDQITALKSELKNTVRFELMKKNKNKNCFSVLSEPQFSSYNIQLYDNNGTLLCWNNTPIFSEIHKEKIKSDIGQVYFVRKDLKTYLQLTDTLNVSSTNYYLTVGQELERHYRLDFKNSTFENITDYLSRLISSKIKIDFDRNAPLSIDGREHSFFLLNNYKNKIGVATFEKPSLDISVKETEDYFRVIQYIIILLIYLSVGLFGIKYYKSFENRIIQFLVLFVYLATLRIVLFYFGIPSNYLHNELTDPSNFSSSFAFGIVRSPLDFFITVILLVIIVVEGYKLFHESYKNDGAKKQTLIKSVFVFLFASFLIFMLYRGTGASLRSVVFDSTIRYFKEFSLIPSPEIFLMDLNILLLGFCALLCSVILLKWILYQLPVNKLDQKIFLILYFIFQILGWIFDTLQVQPQGTPLIRILFVTLLFLITYLTIKINHKTIHFIYYGFASALLVVNLFVYYNSELERESLRTVAYDLTRKNQNIYEFILYQTLVEFKNKQQSGYGEGEINYSAIAFEILNKSLLFRENIPSSVSIYDKDKNYLGGFSSYKNRIRENLGNYFNNLDDEPRIFREKGIYDSSELLIGVTTINKNDDSAKYLVATALFKEYNLGEDLLPRFLTVSREGITSATEYENLKIFVFTGNTLLHSLGGMMLDRGELQEILTGSSNIQGESWLRIRPKGEPYLIFTLKPREKKNEIIAVAMEERRFAWNLSNFFKVFFVHSIIILLIFLLYATRNYMRWKEYFQRYKTKLTLAFILVSVVPLLIIASYIRNINENKNEDLINGYLTEFADQLESYIKKYSVASNLSFEALCAKANDDLNIEFNCYDQQKLVFSTQKYFYEAGILPSTLSPVAYLNSVLSGTNKYFVKENFFGEEYFSIYKKITCLDKSFIFNINTMMNKASIPLRDVELDIFLFGILAVALILLIIFSTILADQISSPIRRLTHATRSIGSGDLNIEVEESGSGEINELMKGFNMMIRKLKKSQIELAQFERETAWKEMAKQVAHEIKNPLTPMKLSVQQLVAAYKDKSPKFDDILYKVTNTIINQIETLKNIASEFSNFARMPKPAIEKIDVIPVVKETLNLFADEKSVIKFISENNSVFVNADSEHLSRAIINLVRNSIQADANNINVKVRIKLNMCEIRVEDNGSGIDPEITGKIFEENFSTKPKGMGIGLSMVKKYIESIGGDISIESTSSKGTTFLIQIPIAE